MRHNDKHCREYIINNGQFIDIYNTSNYNKKKKNLVSILSIIVKNKYSLYCHKFNALVNIPRSERL